jgi:hypothetical protein
MGHSDASASIRVLSWFDDPVILAGLLECFDDRVIKIIEFKALRDNLKDISLVGLQILCEIGEQILLITNAGVVWKVVVN